jgi:hypothetical protein
VNRKDLPKETMIFVSTWAMKKEDNGTFRARNVIWRFQQQDSQHHDSHDKLAPMDLSPSTILLLLRGLWATFTLSRPAGISI